MQSLMGDLLALIVVKEMLYFAIFRPKSLTKIGEVQKNSYNCQQFYPKV